MITAELLDALERRYLPADQQKCVVCGEPLVFSASGNDGRAWTRYHCSATDRRESRKGLLRRLEHWERSLWYDRGQADPHVAELVRAYRELEPRAACPCFDATAEGRLRADAAAFQQEAAALDTEGFVSRTLDAIGVAADNAVNGETGGSAFDTEVVLYCLKHRKPVRWLAAPMWWHHVSDKRTCRPMWAAQAPLQSETAGASSYPGPGNPCPHDGGRISPGFRCAACAKEDSLRVQAGEEAADG